MKKFIYLLSLKDGEVRKMAKNRWEKHRAANSYILRILSRGDILSTNKIKELLELNFKFPLHHRTLKKYLKELVRSGHIEQISIPEKKNEVLLWKRK